MPSTLKHNISYPTGSQAPNVPIVMQTTAESVDAAVDKVVTGSVAKSAQATYASGISPYVAGEHPTVTRQGVLVNLQARVNRTSTGTQLFTLPVGYRPTRVVFVPAMLGSNNVALVQVNMDGTCITPFFTNTGDIMITLTFVCPVSPQPA